MISQYVWSSFPNSRNLKASGCMHFEQGIPSVHLEWYENKVEENVERLSTSQILFKTVLTDRIKKNHQTTTTLKQGSVLFQNNKKSTSYININYKINENVLDLLAKSPHCLLLWTELWFPQNSCIKILTHKSPLPLSLTSFFLSPSLCLSPFLMWTIPLYCANIRHSGWFNKKLNNQ